MTSQSSEELQEQVPQLPQKRTHDAMVTLCLREGRIHRLRPEDLDDIHGDSHYFYDSYISSEFRKMDVKEIDKEPQDVDTSDTDAEDSAPPVNHKRPRSRKELKQLDREIPRRQLMNLPKDQLHSYVEAAVKEAEVVVDMRLCGGTGRAPNQGSDVRSQAQAARPEEPCSLRGQGARTRTSSTQIPGSMLGHLDPDIHSISRESPTPTRFAEHVLFAMMVAGFNRELRSTTHGWTPWLADASTAFLQGQQPGNERPLPLFMAPPKDGLTAMSGE